MMAATPMLAAMAISWMTWIWMKRRVKNPIVSVASAMPPGTSSRRKLVRAAVRLSAPSKISDRVRTHHLDAVAHGDREDEERDENRHRVHAVAEGGHDAELPRHGDDGAGEHEHGHAVRLRVEKDQQSGDAERDQEEHTTRLAPSAMSPMTFEKPTTWMSTGELPTTTSTGAAPAPASNFCLTRVSISSHRDEVEPVPGGGIELHQFGAHHRAREVIGDQPADDAGLEDVAPDAIESLGGGLEIVGDHVAGGDAVFDDLGVADVGREQRLHAAAIDAGQEEDLVGDVLDASRRTPA
jgi:hypothetical protein